MLGGLLLAPLVSRFVTCTLRLADPRRPRFALAFRSRLPGGSRSRLGPGLGLQLRLEPCSRALLHSSLFALDALHPLGGALLALGVVQHPLFMIQPLVVEAALLVRPFKAKRDDEVFAAFTLARLVVGLHLLAFASDACAFRGEIKIVCMHHCGADRKQDGKEPGIR
ncbi:MAG TPA: hypothetical protein VFP68_09465 [Burkholderiaceae bacterium]|nr:hypothetical protein [Burkholderiaceae bacterium]